MCVGVVLDVGIVVGKPEMKSGPHAENIFASKREGKTKAGSVACNRAAKSI